MTADTQGSISVPRQPVHQGPDPLVTVVAGYVIGSLLHGGLDLSLINVDASTNDNRATFTVEGKHNRKRLQISVREIHDTP
jgi:hypothetical protein